MAGIVGWMTALIPYRRYELLSDRPPAEVEASLRAVVGYRRFLGLGMAPFPFEGEVQDGGFTIQRAITYRNSFLPQIRGKITQASQGSRIAISMTLHPFVLAFMVIWLSAAGAGFVFVLYQTLRTGGSPSGAFGVLFMFVFGWALAAGGFASEAREADRLLTSVLHARLA